MSSGTGRSTLTALLGAVALLSFLGMPGEFLQGDPHVWREEARSMLTAGELNVPAKLAAEFGERGMYFVQNERTGLWYSKFGIANSFLSAAPMWVEGVLGSRNDAQHQIPSLLLINLWQVLLTVVLAGLLYALAAQYTARVALRALFVVGALYCSSLWFYTRAQSSELPQTLLFSALFLALLGCLRPLQQHGPEGIDRRAWAWLAAAWACAAALVFTRVVYGLLLPIMVLLAAWCATRGRSARALRDPVLGAALLLPPLLIVCLLGFVNYVKFGAPWLTGYHQWRAETHWPIGRLADGLWGYLFSPRFSIFSHFPLLLFALLGLRRFAAQYRIDAIAMLSIFGLFVLFLAKLPSWAGEWSYGPRYLLPMLPVLSLPFLAFADDVAGRLGSWPARAWTLLAAVVLAYSLYLQVQINRLPFWTYYHARDALDSARSPESIDYFFNRSHAVIADDLLRHRGNLQALPFYAEMKRVATPRMFEMYDRHMNEMVERGNLFWTLPAYRQR